MDKFATICNVFYLFTVETLPFIFIALLLALGVGYMGSKRKIGFGLAFFLALLNVLVGLIAVLCSKKVSPES